MRYAFEDRLISVVGAADTLMDFEEFVRLTDSTTVTPESLGVKSAELASLMDMLTEDRLQGFKKAPVTVEHLSASARDAFNERFGITVMKRNAVVNKHEDMLHAELENPYAADYSDPRAIEEIHDLDKDDRWDRRSDAEKAEDEAQKKAFKEAQKKGDISGDSFGPNPNRKKRVFGANGEPTTDVDAPTGSQVHVTDIKASRNEDGSIEIDNVLAVKGLHEAREGEQDYKELKKAPHDPNRPGATLANSDAAAAANGPSLIDDLNRILTNKGIDALVDDENLEIDTKGHVAIYHKVEVTGAKLLDVFEPLLAAEIDLNHTAIVQRNNAQGCWFSFIRQLQAEEAATVLTTAGFTVETYAVNDAGERLVPKGVQVVDQSAVGDEHPRLWNFRAKEIRKMNAADKKANEKTIKPDEFLFCGNYEGAVLGTIIYVVPRSYFKEHNQMWDKPLNIAHILPMDFKEISPGIYRSNSRDWNHISFDMNSRGFKENLMLQIALNNS
jgi:hypothetical protein